MKLEELKQLIESNNYDGESIIFNNYDNCPFIVHQYIHDIISKNNFKLMNVKDVNDIPIKRTNFLSFVDNNCFYVCYIDNQDELRNIINFKNSVLIYTGKKLKDVLDIEEYIVNIPKLETWQITDYVYTRGCGVDKQDLDYLINLSNSDLFRLEKELDKIELFDEINRKEIFKQFLKDGIFSDLSVYNSFNLIDAIVKKKKTDAFRIFNSLNNLGLNEMGILTLLYNNFRNIIKIQLSPNPTPENTGLKSNQFWAIKKNNIGYYHKEELLYIFNLLVDMDRKIKTGYIPVNKSVEYILINILK